MQRAFVALALCGTTFLAAACGVVTSGTQASPGTRVTRAPEPSAVTATPSSSAVAVPVTRVTTAAPASQALTCAGLPPAATAYDAPYSAVTDSPLAAIEFIGAQQGWAVGYGRIVATVNGGKTWDPEYHGPARLDQVDFVDARHGWAVGEDTLLATSDSGASWTPVGDPCDAIRSVHFVSPELGYAVFGGPSVGLASGVPTVVSGGSLLRTTDGGRTWQAVAGAPGNVQAACFSNPDDGFLATPGRVWRSTNGGRAWAVSLTEPAAMSMRNQLSMTAVECAGPSAAWAYVIGPGAAMEHEPYVAYSTQDGRHWHMLFAELYTLGILSPIVHGQEGPGSYPGPFSAISPDSAAFAGWTPPVGWGQAYLDTVSGGVTVRPGGAVGGLTQPFGIAFTAAQTGWMIGQDQTGTAAVSYVIEATSDGGRTWARQYSIP